MVEFVCSYTWFGPLRTDQAKLNRPLFTKGLNSLLVRHSASCLKIVKFARRLLASIGAQCLGSARLGGWRWVVVQTAGSRWFQQLPTASYALTPFIMPRGVQKNARVVLVHANISTFLWGKRQLLSCPEGTTFFRPGDRCLCRKPKPEFQRVGSTGNQGFPSERARERERESLPPTAEARLLLGGNERILMYLDGTATVARKGPFVGQIEQVCKAMQLLCLSCMRGIEQCAIPSQQRIALHFSLMHKTGFRSNLLRSCKRIEPHGVLSLLSTMSQDDLETGPRRDQR